MKKLLKMSMVGVILLTGCSKTEKQNTLQGGMNQSLFAERSTVNFTSRISSTQSVTLAIAKDANTGALTVSKTVNTADATDKYLNYIVGLTPDIGTEEISLTIPNTGTYYFIPFDDTQNAMTINGGTIVVYKCECCPTGQVGGAGGCSIKGTIGHGYVTTECVSGGCTDCGLVFSERPLNKSGVYVGGTSVTIK